MTFLTLLNTEQIHHYDNQNTASILQLWHYFMQNPQTPQAKKNQHNLFFTQV